MDILLPNPLLSISWLDSGPELMVAFVRLATTAHLVLQRAFGS